MRARIPYGLFPVCFAIHLAVLSAVPARAEDHGGGGQMTSGPDPVAAPAGRPSTEPDDEPDVELARVKQTEKTLGGEIFNGKSDAEKDDITRALNDVLQKGPAATFKDLTKAVNFLKDAAEKGLIKTDAQRELLGKVEGAAREAQFPDAPTPALTRASELLGPLPTPAQPVVTPTAPAPGAEESGGTDGTWTRNAYNAPTNVAAPLPSPVPPNPLTIFSDSADDKLRQSSDLGNYLGSQ